MPILLEDIESNRKNGKNAHLYGKTGDLVTIVSQHGDVFIVSNGKESFPVHKTKISWEQKH